MSTVHCFSDQAGRRVRVELRGRTFRSFADSPEAAQAARDAVKLDLSGLGIQLLPSCKLSDKGLIELLRVAQADAEEVGAAEAAKAKEAFGGQPIRFRQSVRFAELGLSGRFAELGMLARVGAQAKVYAARRNKQNSR